MSAQGIRKIQRTTSVSSILALSILMAGGAAVLMSVPAQAQSSTPREETWMTDGPVNAIVRTADTVYLGGNFNYVGPCTGGGAPLGAATGHAQIPFPDEVLALAVSGSVVYAGGKFARIKGQPRAAIAALDAATGRATAWKPDAAPAEPYYKPYVRALVATDSVVYAGGFFSSIGGQPRGNIAALDAATGSAISWNPNAGGPVLCFAISDSWLHAGGFFFRIGGQNRTLVAALDAESGSATSWDPRLPEAWFDLAPSVFALAISGSTVYVGGYFGSVNGELRQNFAQFDALPASARGCALY